MLLGATTRTASWFYTMMRVLRHKDTLKSTIHTLQFRDLAKSDKIRGAVMDIENEFFKLCIFCCVLYSLPFVLFISLILTNLLWIRSIFSPRTETALGKSITFLNDMEVFGALAKGDDTLSDEIGELWGGYVN